MKEFPNEEIEKLIQNIFPVWQTYFVSTGILDTSEPTMMIRNHQ